MKYNKVPIRRKISPNCKLHSQLFKIGYLIYYKQVKFFNKLKVFFCNSCEGALSKQIDGGCIDFLRSKAYLLLLYSNYEVFFDN